MTTVDVPEPELVVNQAVFYLTLLITIGSAGAIIAQIVRGINARVRRNRDEAEAKLKASNDAMKDYIENRMKEVNDVKARIDYMYWKLIDKWFDDQQHGKSN